MSFDVGDEFQRGTVYCRGQRWASLDWARKPEIYKSYPESKRIQLSLRFPELSVTLVEALKKRRSVRSFSPLQLGIGDLSFLLWACTGIQRKERGHDFRTVPSAGALYPIETYVVVSNVDGLKQGVYHYNIVLHVLEELRLGGFGESLAHAALEQEMCGEAPVTFVWTAVFERSRWKYKQRAYRYVYLDAGHVAQNLALAAVSVGLGSCQVGAIFDEEVNEIVGVDGIEESAIYLSVVGYPMDK